MRAGIGWPRMAFGSRRTTPTHSNPALGSPPAAGLLSLPGFLAHDALCASLPLCTCPPSYVCPSYVCPSLFVSLPCHAWPFPGRWHPPRPHPKTQRHDARRLLCRATALRRLPLAQHFHKLVKMTFELAHITGPNPASGSSLSQCLGMRLPEQPLAGPVGTPLLLPRTRALSFLPSSSRGMLQRHGAGRHHV